MPKLGPLLSPRLTAWTALAEPLGVQCGVVVQTSFMGVDNSRLEQEFRAHPERLRGVAVVAPDTGPGELQRLDGLSVRGIRLNLAHTAHDMTPWARAGRLWDALLALGWHVDLHTDIGALARVLPQLPSALPVVIDHMGKPAEARAADPSVVAALQRARHVAVHVKLSGAYRLGGYDPAALARLWLGELGVDGLLWGSDWPWTNHEHVARYPALLADLREWIREALAGQVLSDNPMSLYWATGPQDRNRTRI